MTVSKPFISRTALFWLLMAVLFAALLWLLRDMLLPFIIGITLAYLLHPLCDALAKRGLNRTLATFYILLIFILLAISVVVLIAPIVSEQLKQLAAALPGYIDSARNYVEPRLQNFMNRLSHDQSVRIRDAATGYAGDMGTAISTVVESLWQGSQAIFSFFSVLIITPIVAFYLLRDWNVLVNKVDSWLPRAHVETIRTQVREIDKTLAGFIRGQATVCFLLGSYYSIALSVMGINYGFVIGLIAGLLSFIPFVGSTFGLVAATAIALVQFDSHTPALITIGIFIFAQVMEGNFITPKFVGESVGLHPVWVIFALMAGGSLLGFTGLLLAVPVAAVIGVLIRFGIGRYLDSAYYSSARRYKRVKPL